jgi:hypothetical protein
VRRSSLVAFAAGYVLAARRRERGPREHAVTLRGQPDSSRRPSDGVVAEASIVARLLRLRLLTLNATVVVSPAVVTEPSRHRQAPPATPPARDGRAPLYVAPAAATAPIGRRLAQAARSVDESAATLAEARREAAAPRRR